MRFSLKWLMVAIAFIAVSLVAVLNANDVLATDHRPLKDPFTVLPPVLVRH